MHRILAFLAVPAGLMAALASSAAASPCPQQVPNQGLSAAPLAGSVIRQQKISETVGGFKGVLTPAGPDPLTDPGDLFGISITPIGDLNGDGVVDLAVGSYGDDDGGFLTGSLWILFMKDDQTVRSQQKISETQGGFVGPIDKGDLFGWSLCYMGDLDRDGAPELAVGGWMDDDGWGDAGAVWILSLNPDGTVKHQAKISATEGGFTGTLADGERFGTSLVNLGDLDGDEVNDLAAGAVYDGQGGHLVGAEWILFLNPDASVHSYVKITNSIGGFTGYIGSYSRFSYSACSMGDLDGDGVVDLAVGGITNIPTYETHHFSEFGCHDQCGAVWILFLNHDGTVKNQTKIAQLEGGFSGKFIENENWAHGVTCPGDLDGDGIQDLLVGDVGYEGDVGGGPNTGSVWTLFMNRDGTVKAFRQINPTNGGFTGKLDAGDFFGQSLCSLGDLNGDGIGDVAVGAIGDDDGGVDQGGLWFVYLYGPNWSDECKASAGSGGFPKLAVESSLQPGAPFVLHLEQAARAAPAMLLVSTLASKKDFLGGTLVPDISVPSIALPFLTDGHGDFTLDSVWPRGISAGFDVYLQFWIKDATTPYGYSSSNALHGVTP